MIFKFFFSTYFYMSICLNLIFSKQSLMLSLLNAFHSIPLVDITIDIRLRHITGNRHTKHMSLWFEIYDIKRWDKNNDVKIYHHYIWLYNQSLVHRIQRYCSHISVDIRDRNTHQDMGKSNYVQMILCKL